MRTPDVFADCPSCQRERRVVAGPSGPGMVAHNRWHEPSYQMVACEGSGQPPAWAESAEEMTSA
jgi:hypothetical protein